MTSSTIIEQVYEFLGLISDSTLASELRRRGYNVTKIDGEVDVNGAMLITGLCKHTIYKLVQQRLIPHKKYGHRTVRFVVQELNEWVEAKRANGDFKNVPARQTSKRR